MDKFLNQTPLDKNNLQISEIGNNNGVNIQEIGVEDSKPESNSGINPLSLIEKLEEVRKQIPDDASQIQKLKDLVSTHLQMSAAYLPADQISRMLSSIEAAEKLLQDKGAKVSDAPDHILNRQTVYAQLCNIRQVFTCNSEISKYEQAFKERKEAINAEVANIQNCMQRVANLMNKLELQSDDLEENAQKIIEMAEKLPSRNQLKEQQFSDLSNQIKQVDEQLTSQHQQNLAEIDLHQDSKHEIYTTIAKGFLNAKKFEANKNSFLLRDQIYPANYPETLKKLRSELENVVSALEDSLEANSSAEEVFSEQEMLMITEENDELENVVNALQQVSERLALSPFIPVFFDQNPQMIKMNVFFKKRENENFMSQDFHAMDVTMLEEPDPHELAVKTLEKLRNSRQQWDQDLATASVLCTQERSSIDSGKQSELFEFIISMNNHLQIVKPYLDDTTRDPSDIGATLETLNNVWEQLRNILQELK